MDGAAGFLLLVVLVALYAGEIRWAPSVARLIPPPPPPPVEPEEAPPPPPPVLEPPPPALPPVDPIARVRIEKSSDSRFGLTTTSGNPDDNSDDHKKLTFASDGATNNTRVWIDGSTPIFGHGGAMTRRTASAEEIEDVWLYRDVEVSQMVKLVAGDISRRMDGVQVTYRLKNTGTTSREVGLRVMIDSLIGGNDGVPFIVPGRQGIIRNATVFGADSIPDFVRALERPDLSNPGVIVDLSLKSSTGDRPDEVVLTHWPGNDALWNYNRTWAFENDSAIGLYYTQRPLAAGADRSMTFTYGLGSISSTTTKNAQLSLTAGGPFKPGKKFWLVALVQKAAGSDQKVTLQVPPGFKLDAEHTATKPVRPTAEFEQISWMIEIEAGAAGEAEFAATLEPGNVTEKFKLNVDAPEKGLRIPPLAAVKSGKKFWVSAQVRNPGANQTVEIQLPGGFSLVAGHEAIKPVAPKTGYAQVDWLIQAASTVGTSEIKVKSMPGNLVEAVPVVVTATLID